MIQQEIIKFIVISIIYLLNDKFNFIVFFKYRFKYDVIHDLMHVS
jgi:hypothetical protein